MLRSISKSNRPTRRQMLRLCCAASLSFPSLIRPAAAKADATQALAARLREAARTGAAVRLPAGEIALRALGLPEGVTLIGVPGRTVLKLVGPGPLLSASFARKIRLESLILDGGDGAIARERGLIDFADVFDLAIRGCTIRRSNARAVNLSRCSGVVAQNTIEHARDAGYFSLDGLGVDIDNNHVRECGDNGVVVWTSSAGRYEGSRVRNNTIEDIHNLSGGNGPYGNGVSIWGSGSVRVENNKIYRCAYTAVRNNAGHGVVVTGNDCKTFGEKAMYAEFGAKASVFRDNKIDDAGAGIAVANADWGTDGAIVTGNRIANLRESHPDKEFGPEMLWLTGILGEKNCEISGNTIIGPAWIGIALGGWRENIRAQGNTIVGADYGVVFATGEGAGDAVITRNKIVGSRKAAIAATAGLNFLPGDVAAPGAMAKYPRLVVRDNEVS
jgi:uncharacterized secreted repeat protein (TIGR03808 family)